MAMTKIPDIAFEIDGDYINLEQDSGCGEVNCVQIHRTHLEHIAGQLGLPSLDASSQVIRRRFMAVIDRLDKLVCTEYYREDILDRCSIGLEFITELDAVLDIGHEFLDDLDTPPARQTGSTAAVGGPVQTSLV